MAGKKYTDQDLIEMACDILRSLKPKGLKIYQLRALFQHAINALDHITYGDCCSAEPESE